MWNPSLSPEPLAETFAGLGLKCPVVMGIINVTPDSFSDGGEAYVHDKAIRRGQDMVADGAAILDIGGESTRPGADPVSIDEEILRVVPGVEALRDCGAVITVDTRHPEVMVAAIEAGAGVINDVTALTHDPRSLTTALELDVPVILMHMQGDPENMQIAPRYDDAPVDVRDYLATRVAACVDAGMDRRQIAVDPGIGFGKTLAHNLQILNRIDILSDVAGPVVLGVSRKSFIGKVCGEDDPRKRVAGSLAAAVLARKHGVQIFRVHDVSETVQALGVADAIEQQSS